MALIHTPQLHSMICPEFSVRATDGKTYSKSDFTGLKIANAIAGASAGSGSDTTAEANAKTSAKGFLVMFICNHCPYVKAIEDRLIALGHFLKERQFPVVAVCSNDAKSYSEDSFENLKKRSEDKKYPFPYLFDESQNMAKSFGAVCTPDFFVFNSNDQLVYRGRLDNSWKDPKSVTQEDLKLAIISLIENRPLLTKQESSMGCSIKWL